MPSKRDFMEKEAREFAERGAICYSLVYEKKDTINQGNKK